jgi:hypothetical protein
MAKLDIWVAKLERWLSLDSWVAKLDRLVV